MPKFETKDGGKRIEHSSGMVRDTTEGKIDYTLALDGPMFQRYAELMDRGAVKYGKRNWMKANSAEEMERAQESLTRHFFQYLSRQTDEDHAAAIIFNLNEIEYIKERLDVFESPEERKRRLWEVAYSLPVAARECPVKSPSRWDCELPLGHAGFHSAPDYCEDWRHD